MSVPLAIVLIALPALGFILFPFWRRSPTATSWAGVEPAAQELLETKRALYRAMKELEFDHQAGHISGDDYERLRGSYEARAARTLKALDQLGVGSDSLERVRMAPRPGEGPRLHWSHRPAILVLGAGALVGFGLALGTLLVKFTAPESSGPAGARGTAAVPAPLTGSSQEERGRAIPPEMLRGMLDAAHQSLEAGRFQEAIAAYKAILARDPQNVEAITHLGIILGMAGHTDAALEALDKALAIDPTYPHALWDKGRLLYEARQDYAAAIRAWERFIAVAPPGADRDQALRLIQEAKERLVQKK